ncbi:MAG: MarR family winged helix-turn-helix transcriptional regulator [Egibacteraceae bacterium]
MGRTAVDSELQRLDTALVRLRHLWDSPDIKRRFLELLGRPVELSLVRTLRAMEIAAGDPGVSAVAETLHVDASTASRFVDQAVARGWVSRNTSTQDRRRCVLALTDDGAELLVEINTARAELLAELTNGWPDADVTVLSALLERLSQSLPVPATHPEPS